MARDVVDLTPIESRDELVAWFAEGVKPKAQWRVGTEHEKFAFTTDTHDPVPYEGRRSIRSLLVGMQHLLGWEPIMDGPNIIGLADVTGGGAISLEPGGQFELSGAPLETIHQTCSELMAAPQGTEKVQFGSTVTIERDDGRRQTWRIVGEDEAEPSRGTLSYASPVARALMGKSVGDVVHAGSGEAEIVEIR